MLFRSIGWDIYIRMEYLTSFMEYCAGRALSEDDVIRLGIDLCKACLLYTSPDVMEYLDEHKDHRELWKGVPISRDGKVQLRDGRTGAVSYTHLDVYKRQL